MQGGGGSRSLFANMKSAYLALLLSFSCATFAQAASKKTSARKKPAAVKVLNAKKGSRRVAAVPRQALPSADRYKEIQQALASKGYLKSEPTGVWDAHSVDAMRQFQSDRKLDPSGKLTAASLIDLGSVSYTHLR